MNGVQPWFSGLKFILRWPISAPKLKIVHHLKVFLKIFQFPQCFPMFSKLSDKEFKQNSTRECCTTLHFRPKVHLYNENQCPKDQDCTQYRTILKNFLVCIILYVLKIIWKRLLAKLNLWMEYNPIFWPKVYLNMTNQCPKAHDCTPYGSFLKIFLGCVILYILKMIWKRFLAKLNLWRVYNPGFLA